MNYIDKVKTQLSMLSEGEKDAWILSQAKLVSENYQEDFLLSLSGEKKIINMPSSMEIEKFCKQVDNGEIYLEYETHYYEFDDDGRYMGDWKIWYNDPFTAIPFLNRIFSGCHDLLCLEEYQMVFDVLGKLFKLEFSLEEAEASDDCPEEEYLSLTDVDKEDMFAQSLSNTGRDWIIAYVNLTKELDNKKRAHILIEMLEHPICRKLKPRILLENGISQETFSLMAEILEKEIFDLETHMKRGSDIGFHERFELKDTQKRKKELLSDIRVKCLKVTSLCELQNNSDLAENWESIMEIIDWLNIEEYIDDQPILDDIQEISETIIENTIMCQEDWQLRKRILNDIVENQYGDIYGCDDVMMELAEKLCTNDSEHLYYAGILESSDDYKEEAAHMYFKYGREDKYVSYLEANLGQKSKEYKELLAYYEEHGQQDNVVRVAQLGLEKCKEDLTDLFIYLLQNTKKDNDQKQFQKLYASAKRRKHVDIEKVNKAI